MGIFVAIAGTGILCLMSGIAGLQEDSVDLGQVTVNLGVGLTAVLGTIYFFLGRRRKLP